MKSFDLNAYDERVFDAIAKLIHDRDPSLGEDEIKQESLDLMRDRVQAASVLSLSSPDQPAPKREELENLYRHAVGMAGVLENLSTQSNIELRYISGSKQLPDLKRLQLDAKDLSDALQEGLKKRPPLPKNRPKDVTMAILVEEATDIFELATGIILNELPNPRAQSNRNIMHDFYQFVANYMLDPDKYNSESQYTSLTTYIKRYLTERTK